MAKYDWSQGYVADIEYIYHFNREVSPLWLRTLCLLRNVVTCNEPVTYLELGSGQGYGLSLMAAANPDSTFVGVDFNPSHIVGARQLAREARLQNITFFERSFEDLAGRLQDLPDSDVIVLHGVYTWVGSPQRDAIRRIVSSKLKTGGLLYIGYNCMAGWAHNVPLQALLQTYQTRRARDSIGIKDSIEEIRNLQSGGLEYLHPEGAAGRKLLEIEKANLSYVAHEYLNAFWRPMFMRDMVEDMGLCKLTFVGSARPADNIDEFTVKPAILKVLGRENDQVVKETIKDIALNTTFRQDIFVRGLLRHPVQDWRECLGSMKLLLTRPKEEIQMEVAIPRGTVQMRRPLYSAAVEKMAKEPSSLGELVQDGEPLVEAIVLMLQSGWAAPAVDATLDAAPARRLNAALARMTRGPTVFPFFASPAMGSALHLKPVESRALAAMIREPGLSLTEVAGAADTDSDQEARAAPEPGATAEVPLTASLLQAKLERWQALGLL